MFSTALLLIPEIQELAKRPTDLKIVGLALNIIIVVYLIIRLPRRRKPHLPPTVVRVHGGERATVSGCGGVEGWPLPCAQAVTCWRGSMSAR